MGMLRGVNVPNFAELSSYCVHYCDVAGHLWLHKGTTPAWRCSWKTPEGKHKFFSLCPEHRPKSFRVEDDGDWY